MAEAIDVSIYRDILSYEGVGLVVWDLEKDEIVYDEMLEKILATPLQREHFSQVLLNRVHIHPNDHKFFLDLVAFLSRSHDSCVRSANIL